MFEEAEQLTLDDETTLVAPRFDDEETVVARRVVPLEVAEAGARAATQADMPTRKSRRSAVLALAFASALAGGVLGGVGLHIYQSRAASNPPPAANPNERADAPAEAAQTAQADRPAEAKQSAEADQPAQLSPQPAPASDTPNVSPAPAEQHDTPAGASESQPAPAEPKAEDQPGADAKGVDRADANKPAKSPAAGARADDDEARPDARRHGKKGAHEEQGRLLGRREDSGRELSRDDATFGGDLRGETRDSDDPTFARPRRASHHARHERRRPVDSIRGIFEGQP